MLRLPNFLVLSLTAAVALTSCTDIEDEILIEFCPVEWNIPEDITSAGGVCSEPCVAAGLGDIIHIAWSKKYGAGVHEIHLVNSTDCFATTTRISHLGIYSEYPSIAVDSGGRRRWHS